MQLWRAVVLFVCLCGAGAASAATAGAPAPTPISMDQAVKMAQQRYHARVVKAEAQRSGAQTVYVLRLLDEAGKVWTVRVDAATGSLQ